MLALGARGANDFVFDLVNDGRHNGRLGLAGSTRM